MPLPQPFVARALGTPVPAWLLDYQPGQAFQREEFFRSRIVYYPGCGSDLRPVRVFGLTGSAHVFIHADYIHRFRRDCDDLHCGLRGYRVLDRRDLELDALMPRPWTPHASPDEARSSPDGFVRTEPFASLVVLEREAGCPETEGPARLAIVWLGFDGIAAYDALFCQTHSFGPPFALMLQDHGFGGNYDRFGGGGLMDLIARRSRCRPEWLMLGPRTEVWDGYREMLPADRFFCFPHEAGTLHRREDCAPIGFPHRMRRFATAR